MPYQLHFNTFFHLYSHTLACLSTAPLATILMAHEEEDKKPSFLFIFKSLHWNKNPLFPVRVLADLYESAGVSVTDSKLTARASVAPRESERRRDRLRD